MDTKEKKTIGLTFVSFVSFVVIAFTSPGSASVSHAQQAGDASVSSEQALINRYCTTCHSTRMKAGNLVLAGVDATAVQRQPRALGKGRPQAARRTDAAGRQAAARRCQPTSASSRSCRASSTPPPRGKPNPGRTEIAHRLNRIEYRECDPRSARRGDQRRGPAARRRFELRVRQHRRRAEDVAGAHGALPGRGARRSAGPRSAARRQRRRRRSTACRPRCSSTTVSIGCRSARAVAPSSATSSRSTPSTTSRWTLPAAPVAAAIVQQLEITIDGVQVSVAPLGARANRRSACRSRAAPHEVAVTFLRVPPDLVEQVREPFLNPAAPSGTGGHGRPPAVGRRAVTITGPHNANGPGDTPSRRRLFTCTPANASQEAALRPDDSHDAGAARLPWHCRHASSVNVLTRVLRERARRGRQLRRRHRAGAAAAARQPRVPVSRSKRIRSSCRPKRRPEVYRV